MAHADTQSDKKPEIRVIVWKFKNLQNVGYAALELSDGTYISWWPKWKKSKGLTIASSVEAERDRTFEKDKSDVEGKGCGPDHIVKLPVSREDAMSVKYWWNSVLQDEKEKYNLHTNNCSTIVYRALREAGFFKAINEPTVDLWTPDMLLEYATNCMIDRHIKDPKKEVDKYIRCLSEKISTALGPK